MKLLAARNDFRDSVACLLMNGVVSSVLDLKTNNSVEVAFHKFQILQTIYRFKSTLAKELKNGNISEDIK